MTIFTRTGMALISLVLLLVVCLESLAGTKPVEVELTEGRNSLQFTAKSPNKGFSMKGFTLQPVK